MDSHNVTVTIQEFAELWKLLFPMSEAPAQSQWAYWVLRHGTAVVREGILELAQKHRKLEGKMDSRHMAKFASTVMKGLSLKEKAAQAPTCITRTIGNTIGDLRTNEQS